MELNKLERGGQALEESAQKHALEEDGVVGDHMKVSERVQE